MLNDGAQRSIGRGPPSSHSQKSVTLFGPTLLASVKAFSRLEMKRSRRGRVVITFAKSYGRRPNYVGERCRPEMYNTLWIGRVVK